MTIFVLHVWAQYSDAVAECTVNHLLEFTMQPESVQLIERDILMAKVCEFVPLKHRFGLNKGKPTLLIF
jgi:hypothetical protein